MLKMLAKCALALAVALLVVVGMSGDSHAAKRKAAISCKSPAACATACANNVCVMNWCGMYGKWHPSGWCMEPFCSPKC